MPYFNIDAVKKNTFDAIVIGSGISGGWAAKELCDGGLKTLVLERGRDINPKTDYTTNQLKPWQLKHLNDITLKTREANPIVSKCYLFHEDCEHFFVKDNEHPYIQEQPFDWIRGYQVGGRSLTWGRGTQRWSKYDFEGPKRDGFDNHWPISYDDLAPWYSHVEIFSGICGNRDGLEQLPDGEFLPPFEQTCIEQHFSKEMATHYKGTRPMIIARAAHLTLPKEIHYKQGRLPCHNRDLCQRGCPYGAYFSSNSSTLPWAKKTGNLTLIPNAVVHSIIYDKQLGRATGVRVINRITKEENIFYAKVIFCNASTINTNIILLNSITDRFPNGLGNDNNLIGKYIHHHNFRTYVYADYEGFNDKKMYGNRPVGSYIPRFRNLFKQDTDFLRGYAILFKSRRNMVVNSDGFGIELKKNLLEETYKNWTAESYFMGETIPVKSNYMTLDKIQKDNWGVPLARLHVMLDENSKKMEKDYQEQMTEMFTMAGFTNISTIVDEKWHPGLDIHEMGGVFMGDDPSKAPLNKHNQLHYCKNVFVTDGACMVSCSTQNPSLTYMALTARAANFAISELKKNNL